MHILAKYAQPSEEVASMRKAPTSRIVHRSLAESRLSIGLAKSVQARSLLKRWGRLPAMILLCTIAGLGSAISSSNARENLTVHARMSKPTRSDVEAVASVLGKGFPTESGVYRAKMRVSRVDLNGDGVRDLVVVQKGLCSNHACDFHFLVHQEAKWKEIGQINSWAIPYIIQHPGRVADVVAFDHISDDCSSCSPPSPILYEWHRDSEHGPRFKRVKAITTNKEIYKPSWK